MDISLRARSHLVSRAHVQRSRVIKVLDDGRSVACPQDCRRWWGLDSDGMRVSLRISPDVLRVSVCFRRSS